MRIKLIRPIATLAFLGLTIAASTGEAAAQYAYRRPSAAHWAGHAAMHTPRYAYLNHMGSRPISNRYQRYGAHPLNHRLGYAALGASFGYAAAATYSHHAHPYYYTHSTYGYNEAPEAYAQPVYAPQPVRQQTYLVPTTVYQPVTRTYAVPVTTYQQVQRTEYVPMTVYRTVHQDCGCNGY